MKELKEILQRIATKKVVLQLDDSKTNIRVKGNIKSLTEADKLDLKKHKQAIIQLLNKQQSQEIYQIPNVFESNDYPVSNGQYRLWGISQLEEASIAYNMPFHKHLKGVYDVKTLTKAVQKVMERHEALRTVFKLNDSGELRQQIIPVENFNATVDFQDYSDTDNASELAERYIATDQYLPFDLENGPLIRVAILQLNAASYICYGNLHHIICDGWSLNVLQQEILKYYESYLTGEKSDLSSLRIQYKDYANWQLDQIEKGILKQSQSYWEHRLSGTLPTVEIPKYQNRPLLKTYASEALTTYINPELTRKLKAFLEHNGGSLYIGLLTVWNILLHKYTSNSEVIIGTPVAGRSHAELENQVGFYVNTLALRNTIDPEESFVQHYERIKRNTLKDYNHQDYPFDNLVELLSGQRDMSRNAIIDIMLILNNDDHNSISEIEDFTSIIAATSVGSKFDLEIEFNDVNEFLTFSLVYNSDIYDKATSEKMMHHFRQLLEVLVTYPETAIRELSYLTDAEQHFLLETQNNTTTTYPKEKTIIEIFENQVTITPNQIAVVFEEKELTYNELNAIANQFGAYLREKYEIQRDDFVGVLLDKSECMMISLLGILKSGAAYVAIAPDTPKERIHYIKNDTRCKIIIDVEEYQEFMKTAASYAKENIKSINTPNDLAYVSYTSGTTGKPKGVLITHNNVVSLVKQNGFLSLTEKDNLLTTGAIGFDATTIEYWGILLNGGKLVVCAKTDLLLSEKLKTLITQQNINIMWFTSGWFNELVDVDIQLFSGLKTIMVGGDVLSPEHIHKVQHTFPELTILNGYGPTENTTFSTVFEINKNNSDLSIPIGKPINNSKAYILDRYRKPVPIGVYGTLYVSGDGLSKGYLNQPKLTEEKFVENPFHEGKMYNTGDLVRWLPDGNIEFLGRQDFQVKVRGHRIELGEIESEIYQYGKTMQQVLVRIKEIRNEKTVVAYYKTTETISRKELISYLKERLPEYMIPSYFVEMTAFPLTNQGKVDTELLPIPTEEDIVQQKYIAPSNTVEKQLVALWQKILNVERVGVKDDFFELGGHSLKMIRLLNEYHKIFLVKPDLKELFLKSNLTEHASLIAKATKNAYKSIPKIALQESYKISSGQKRLWLLEQMEDELSAYTMPFVTELSGHYNIESIQKSFQEVIKRHEILRTVFKKDESGTIRQYIQPENTIVTIVSYQDCRNIPEQKSHIQSVIGKDSNKAFDLEKGPLIRAILFQLTASEFILYYNLHHIISDGFSMNIFRNDLLAYYDFFEKDIPLQLPELNIQYKDYVVWEKEQLSQNTIIDLQEYWKEKLSGELHRITLPTYKKRPPTKTLNGLGLEMYFDKQVSNQIQAFVKNEGGSTFIFLLTVWKLLLYRYTLIEDITVGIPASGRTHPDLDHQIGFYVNTLVSRTIFEKEQSFLSFYHQHKIATLEDYKHQAYPFSDLVELLGIPIDKSRSTLFDVFINLINSEQKLSVSDEKNLNYGFVYQQGASSSKFDLEIFHENTDGILSCQIIFNSDVYDTETIKSFMQHFYNLVNTVLQQPDVLLDHATYLTQTDKAKLLYDFNDTEYKYNTALTLIDLFKTQVDARSEHIALVFEDRRITYKELDDRSNQLANFLKDKHNIQVDDFVGVKLERSEFMVISLLAILKLGAAYIPIDPTYPEKRIAFIENDSQYKLLIDKEFINTYKKEEANVSGIFEAIKIPSKTLAYVIYTSGTTGNPKGVKNTHEGLLNRLLWTQEYFNLDPDVDVILQKTTFSFDVSVWEFFWPLIVGAKLVLAAPEGHKDVAYLQQIIKEEQITTIHFVPSMLTSFLLEAQKTEEHELKRVLCSGEALTQQHASDFREYFGDKVHLFNLYGPTEAAIDVTCFPIHHKNNYNLNSVPIGKPVYNTSIYILNSELELCGIGIVGELYIGGTQVAEGYLNRPELTKERFLKNPFSNKEEASKIYRTGDLARWLPDGTIEYIGRIDEQVKIRGYRIELHEIQQALVRIENEVSQAVVCVVEREQQKFIAAYIVSKKAILHKEVIKEELQKVLPDYMIPTHYVAIDEIPLNANGKLDRKQLPEVSENDLIQKAYVTPSTDTEVQLVQLWKEILKVETISAIDDFFLLGGNSLSALKLVSGIRSIFHKEIEIKDVFIHSVLRDTALLITKASYSKQSIIPITSRPKEIPLSFAQERIWFIDKLEGSSHYHIPYVLETSADLNSVILEKAFLKVLQRHEVLRTVIREKDGKAYQMIQSESNFSITVETDVSKTVSQEQYCNNIINKPFDLSKDYMVRANLLLLSEERKVLVIVFHHIASDGWSLSIFVDELQKFYHEYLQGTISDERPLPIQYADYSLWQRSLLEKNYFADKLSYWKEKLRDVTPTELPTDYTRPFIQSYNGKSCTFKIDSTTQKQLQELCEKSETTLFMVLLAIYKITLHVYSGETDICVGTTIANRTHRETEALIGFFVNLLALRTEFENEDTFLTVLSAVKKTTLEAFKAQEVPFEMLVDELVNERDRSKSPIFQTMFMLQNYEVSELDFGSDDFILQNSTEVSAKYDLSFIGQEVEDGLLITVDYCSDLYTEEKIQQFIKHYKQVVATVIETPNKKVKTLDVLTEDEKQNLYQLGNKPQEPLPYETLKDWFENQVIKTPEAIALVLEDTTITYKKLNENVNKLVHHLKNEKVQKGDFIPIFFEKSFEMITAILALLKIGAIYVPIDVKLPAKRISFIINDVGANLILAHTDKPLPFLEEKIKTVNIDQLTYSNLSIANPKTVTKASDLIYTIYTSGSTGLPKGVLISQDGVINLVAYQTKNLEVVENDRVFQFSNYAFDASVEQIFLTLLNGATLILHHLGKKNYNTSLSQLLKKHNVTFLYATPSMLTTIEDFSEFENIRIIVAGGEVCPTTLAERKGNQQAFYNIYGPTETTISSTVYKYDEKDTTEATLSIGEPVASTQLYILSENSILVPFGAIGELYIAGKGVAQGYLNREKLTKERFLKIPEISTQKMYATGDLVRWMPNGNLQYISRKDTQIKIRGFRVEANEIQYYLNQIPDIQESHVLLKTLPNGHQLLVAYIVSSAKQIDEHALKQELRETLPYYMIPEKFVSVSEFTLTLNGKLDVKALPVPEILSIDRVIKKAETPLQKQLEKVWKELLELDEVGIDDNFFEIGGDSILAIQLVSRLQSIGLQIELSDLFVYQSIAQLSRKLSKDITPKETEIVAKKSEVFCIPGLGGLPVMLYSLGELLQKDFDVHFLTDPGFKSFQKDSTVEELAIFYYQEIQKITTSVDKPLTIIGYSFGALIAYEVVKLLNKNSQNEHHIIVLDAQAPHRTTFDMFKASEPYFIKMYRACKTLLQINDLNVAIHISEFMNKSELEIEQLIKDKMSVLENGILDEVRFVKVYVRNGEAILKYVPRIQTNIKAKITLFKTAKDFKDMDEETIETYKLKDYGWSALLPEAMNVYEVEGSHQSMLKTPNVEIIATQIKNVLNIKYNLAK